MQYFYTYTNVAYIFIIKLLNSLDSFQKIMYGRRFYLIRQILFRILDI